MCYCVSATVAVWDTQCVTVLVLQCGTHCVIVLVAVWDTLYVLLCVTAAVLDTLCVTAATVTHSVSHTVTLTQ